MGEVSGDGTCEPYLRAAGADAKLYPDQIPLKHPSMIVDLPAAPWRREFLAGVAEMPTARDGKRYRAFAGIVFSKQRRYAFVHPMRDPMISK